jgi:lantibiotic modifying enzyme
MIALLERKLRMNQIVEKTLKETNNFIAQHPPKTDYLLAGSLGLGLYYSQLYAHYEQDVYLDKSISIVEDVFNKLNGGSPGLLGSSFSSGVAGLAYLTNFLAGQGWLEMDVEAEFDTLEEYLYNSALKEIALDYVDYLHGAFGCIHYFTTRKHSPRGRYYLNGLVNELLPKVVWEENGAWIRNLMLRSSEREEVNLGLAHGQCSMLMILMDAFDVLDNKEQVRKVIRQGVEFILVQKKDINTEENMFNIFPFHVNKQVPSIPIPNRLAWCYSDLNEVLLFYKAARFLEWDELRKLADLVGLQTLMRKDRHSTLIEDSHFCHGSSGVAQVYRTLYQETGLAAYAKGYEYWIEQTVLMLENELKTDYYRGKEVDLLEGLTGVGLTLLSFISPKPLQWSRLLLL